MIVFMYALSRRAVPIRYEFSRAARPLVTAGVLYALATLAPLPDPGLRLAAKVMAVVLYPVLVVAGGFARDVEPRRLLELLRFPGRG